MGAPARKLLKWLLAAALLPVAYGLSAAAIQALRVAANQDTFWAAFLAGAGCWLAVFVMLPRPMWLYVVGHELTHALSTWMFGGRVKRFKATAKGGQVVITRNNFFISLAPYFIPFYSLLLVLFWGLGDALWGWKAFAAWFHLLLGFTYAFHVTLTGYVLSGRQSDLAGHGYFFSAVIIYSGNVAIILLGTLGLTGAAGAQAVAGWFWQATAGALRQMARWF